MECLFCHNPLRREDRVFCPVCGGAVPDPPLREYDWYVSWEGPRSAALLQGLAAALERHGVPVFVPDRDAPPPPDHILAGCKSLVLVVSPEAAQSRQVANEIEWWMREHGPSSILAVLFHGGRSRDLPFGLTPPQLSFVAHLGTDKTAELIELLSMPAPRPAPSAADEDAGTWSGPASTTGSGVVFPGAGRSEPSPAPTPPLPEIAFPEPVPPPSDEFTRAFLTPQTPEPAPPPEPIRFRADVRPFPDEPPTREMPPPPPIETQPPIGDVSFTLTAPSCLPPGSSSELTFWCHLDSQRETVLQRAMQSLSVTAEREIAVKSGRSFGVALGSVLSVSIDIQGLEIEPERKEVRWTGQIGNASFVVSVSPNAVEGTRKGTASIRAGGIEFAKLHFVVVVRHAAGRLGAIEGELSRHKTAFASYAAEDRDQVLARIQGILTAIPSLEVFVDVLSLRAGNDWGQQIQDRIPSCDVFYLFWSRSARASEWVDEEWRCALQAKGLEFIDPVPLDPPGIAPPPQELAAKHFNDPLLAYLK